MAVSSIPSDPRVQEALAFWRDYQKQHDVGDRIGQAVGLDPVGRRVWFGVNASAVAAAARADGVNSGVLVIRVGHDYYLRKGGRR
jgi:hypothetical protein